MFCVERLKPNVNDEVLDRLPIVTSSDGVLEPVATFVAELTNWGSRPVDSVADEVYILCGWCNFLERFNLTWDTAGETDVLSYIAEAKLKSIGSNRIGRRIAVITKWYLFLVSRKIGGAGVASFATSLTDRPLDLNSDIATPRFKTPRGSKSTHGDRHTPSAKEADLVLQALSDHKNEFIAHRNFALGATVIKTGLRAVGLHQLSISFLNGVLAKGGVIKHDESIDWYGDDKTQRDEIRTKILSRDALGAGPFIGYLEEKTGLRQVKFPYQTILALLSFVWGPRHKLIKNRYKGRRIDPLWLSARQCSGLSRGAIKDIFKQKGFGVAHVEGSGHRLRATFLTMKALQFLLEAKRRFGNRYDRAAILTQLAMLAGHATTDSLKVYLDEALIIAGALDDTPENLSLIASF